MNYYNINIHAAQVSVNFGTGNCAAEHTPDEVVSMATAAIKQSLREQYTPKKRHNMLLADAYQLTQMDNAPTKAVRLATCARWLEFAVPPEGDDKRYKVVSTSSCHVRLCPVCQWRRSLNTYRNLAQIYAHSRLKGYKHIFVTLTVQNCSGEALGGQIDLLSKAYMTMMRRKPMKDLVKGYTRTIEVTRNENGTYHPHIHAIWTVAASYGHKEYIRQKDLCYLWQDACKLEYTPICDMRKIQNMDGKSVAEVAKYSVKPSEYIMTNIQGTAEIISVLDSALDGKRFVSYGGIIREIKQSLFHSANLEDIETNSIPAAEWETWERLIYEWHFYDQEYRIKKDCRF